jgi:hypothetical protein
LADVLASFRMPGDRLITDYQNRLRAAGAGIGPRTFIERVVWPLLVTLQISREELQRALKIRTGHMARFEQVVDLKSAN